MDLPLTWTLKQTVFKTHIGMKFLNSSIFDNKVHFLDPFQKFISIRKPIGSGLERVATDSDLKSYLTKFFSKNVLKNALENVKIFFPIFFNCFTIQETPSETLALQLAFQKKTFHSFHYRKKTWENPNFRTILTIFAEKFLKRPQRCRKYQKFSIIWFFVTFCPKIEV